MPILLPIREQVDTTFATTVDNDDYKYRVFGGGRATRDIPPFVHDRMLAVALNIYRVNPLAYRIMELIRDFTIGGGIVFECEESEVQRWWDMHWHSPLNRWDERLPRRVNELYLFGEMCLYARKNERNGDIWWQYVSPFDIEDVELDPHSYELYRSIVVKPSMGYTEGVALDTSGLATNAFRSIRLQAIEYDSHPESPTLGYYVGEALFYAVNRTSDSKRGISRLFNLAEWLDGMDQYFFNRLERSAHMNMWMWDVLLEGFSEEQIEKWLNSKQAAPPRPGAIRAHNERVKWSPVGPDISGNDASQEAELFMRYIAGAAGFGSHFLGMFGGDLGAMASAEMTAPVLKTLEFYQDEIRFFLKRIFDYVIDQRILAGMLDRNVSKKVNIIMPRISMRDLQRSSGAFLKTTQTVQQAIAANLLTQEEGRAIVMNMVDQLGLSPRQQLIQGRAELEN